jgi:hypothetical protein
VAEVVDLKRLSTFADLTLNRRIQWLDSPGAKAHVLWALGGTAEEAAGKSRICDFSGQRKQRSYRRAALRHPKSGRRWRF